MEELSTLRQRNKSSKVEIDFTASERETRKLLVGKNLSKSLGGQLLFKGLDIVLSPGTRLGVVGKNGTGKTTLLKLLAQDIQHVRVDGDRFAGGVNLAAQSCLLNCRRSHIRTQRDMSRGKSISRLFLLGFQGLDGPQVQTEHIRDE